MTMERSLRGFQILSALLAGLLVWSLLSNRLRQPPPPPAAEQPPERTLTPASFADLPGWTSETFQDLCHALAGQAGPGNGYPCGEEAAASPSTWRTYFEAGFRPYLLGNRNDSSGLITGYYEPTLRGSRRPHGAYRYPLYRRPDDLVSVDLGQFRKNLAGKRIAGRVVKASDFQSMDSRELQSTPAIESPKLSAANGRRHEVQILNVSDFQSMDSRELQSTPAIESPKLSAANGRRHEVQIPNTRLVPYPTRAAIESGALDGKGLELAFVDDKIDAFFLHVQGSGRIELDDGTQLRVGYDGQNGRPYTSIGKLLIERGALSRRSVSMQSIKQWLRRHPGEVDQVLNSNESYIFFRELTKEGPVGSLGVPLTPWRSIAVDRRFIPLGSLLWLETITPDGRPLSRLVVAQDTGGAIKGVIRGDLFLGHGKEAEEIAGRMKQPGRLWLLLPKSFGLSIDRGLRSDGGSRD